MFRALAVTYPSLADPLPSSPLRSASAWIEGALLGSVATVVAVICVASLGLMMFLGRVPVRRGLMIVLGCFLLFGAPVVATGLRSALAGGEAAPTARTAEVAPLPPPVPKPAPRPSDYDPYAGASVPPA